MKTSMWFIYNLTQNRPLRTMGAVLLWRTKEDAERNLNLLFRGKEKQAEVRNAWISATPDD